MKTLDNNTNFPITGCTLTVGNFDGLHRGHSQIINSVKEICSQNLSKSLVVTFNPHPSQILFNDCNNYVLTSLSKKIELLNDSEIDFVYIIDFDEKFSNIDADDFIKYFLYQKFKPSDIVVGYDHCFGKNRKGSFDIFKQYAYELNYNLHRVNKIKLNDLDIKSNVIRNLLRDGSIQKANDLLGRKFSFYGKVIHGKGLGKKLSLPTANIQMENSYQLFPKNGVYSTNLIIKKNKKSYNSVCNIGVRPTFGDNRYKKTIEVHILSNEEFNIYNHEIELIFKERIRDEIKFNDEKELINQINLDKEYCINN